MINSFSGQYRFLSNFYCPAPIVFQADTYPCTENAYQAAKYEAGIKRRPFLTCTPAEAKRFGRRRGCRADWLEVREATMFYVCWKKFSKHPDLTVRLLETYPHELVEGNHWGDVFWGVCNGTGENRLGKILMRIRERLI